MMRPAEKLGQGPAGEYETKSIKVPAGGTKRERGLELHQMISPAKLSVFYILRLGVHHLSEYSR